MSVASCKVLSYDDDTSNAKSKYNENTFKV